MSAELTGQGRRILVADDIPSIHEDFRKILASPESESTTALADTERALLGSSPAPSRRARFRIDSAFQGDEAVSLAEKAVAEGDPYAMAFVDVRMPPGCDGIEVVRRILTVDPRIQIVICTAYSDYSWEEMFDSLDGYEGIVILRKPFDPIEALQLAHALTGKWRLHRQSEREKEGLERRVAERTSELRRTEALYRGAISGAGAIPYVLDYGTQNYAFIGEQIQDLIGFSPAEMSVGLWDRIVKESVMLGEAIGLSMNEAVASVRRGEIRNWRCDMHVVTRSGESRWISDASVLECDATGEPVRAMGILQDITDRRSLEEQFLRAQRLESIGTLAGGIAHDLNNILAPITMAVGLLQELGEDSEQCELLSTIEVSARRGADMVSQVLSFARGVEGERVRVQVQHLLRDIEKMANDTFLKNIQVITDISSSLWNVYGDSTQLHQVLLNLCVNARDAMPDGGRLTLGAENVRLKAACPELGPDGRPGPYIAVRVTDTGIGIDPENVDQIFAPFFTTKTADKGTGLGLSTSASIVRSHGGLLRVRSVPGEGSEFTVYLPAQPDGATAAVPEGAIPRPRGNGELILVVDDEEHVRRMVQYVLESFGYRVALAATGGDALTLFTERRNDISAVVTDVMMPGMSGIELIGEIRGIDPGMPILAASGVHGTDEKLKAAGNEGVGFLRKPYSVGGLLKTLHQILAEIPGKAAASVSNSLT